MPVDRRTMTHTESAHERPWRWALALLAITLLALALRWYYVSHALVLNPVRGDARHYFAYAWNLANHGVFARDAMDATTLHPDSYRDPGYPLFLAIWMKMLGAGDAWYAAVLICQALLGALTVTFATLLGRHWLPARWAIGAGVLMAVWPHSITINGFLLSETLFGFLCALGLWLLARASVKQRTWPTITAGAVLGAAALTNAILLPFGFLLAGFLAWRKLAPRKFCVALAIGALLLPGLWAIRNTQIPPPAVGASSKDRALQNLVQGAWPSYHSAYRDSFFGDDETREAGRNTLRAIDAEYAALRDTPAIGARAILHRLGQHPLRYAGWYIFQKPAELWGWSVMIGQGDIYVYPTKNAPFQISAPWIALAAIGHAINPLVMLLTLVGLGVTWWQHRRHLKAAEVPTPQMAPIATACLLVFITLVFTALQAEPRYSIPFRSFEMLLATTTVYAIATWWRHQQSKSGTALD